MDRPRLHFVGIGGAGMSGLALVAHALGAASPAPTARPARPTPRRCAPPGSSPRSATPRPTCPPAPRSWSRARSRPTTRSARSPASAASASCTARTCSASSPGCARRSPSPARTARRRPRACSSTRSAAAGWTRPTSSAARSARPARTPGWGAGEWLVVEADESDRSLLKLAPGIAVLTNAELDHHTTYASQRDVDDTFRAFLALADRAAVVWDRPGAARAGAARPAGRRRSTPTPELDRGRLALHARRRDRRAERPRRPQRPQRRGRADRGAARRRRPGRGAAALRDFEGAGRRFEASGPRRRCADRRRLRPPPDRGRRDARRRPHARAAPGRSPSSSRTSTPHRPPGDRVRRGARAADVVVVLDVYAARERAEDLPGVSGLLVAEAAADAAGGGRSPGCRASTPPRPTCAACCGRATLC